MSAALPQVQASRQRSVLNSSVVPGLRNRFAPRSPPKIFAWFVRGQIGQQSLCGSEPICITSRQTNRGPIASPQYAWRQDDSRSGLQFYISIGTFRDPFLVLDEFNFRPAEGIDHYPISRTDDDRGSFSFDYRSAFERLTRRERFERIDWNLAPLAKERLSRCAWDTSR